MKKLALLLGAALLLPLSVFAADGVGFVVKELMHVKMWTQIAVCFLVVAALVPLCLWRSWHVLVAEILAGVILGPTVFGRFWPEGYSALFPQNPVQSGLLQGFAHIGIIFMLFDTGLKIKPEAALRRGRASLWIGAGGVLIPLALGTVLTLGFIAVSGYQPPGPRLLYALFLGNVIAVSAIFIIVRFLEDYGQRVTEFGQTVICGYAINDVIAWLIFGIIFQVAAGGSVTMLGSVVRFTLAVAGTYLILKFGPKWIDRLLELVKKKYGSKWVIRTVLMLAIACGLITSFFNLTFYYGIFLAGILVSESPAMTEDIRRRMTDMTQDIMVPIYFVSIGLTVDFGKDFHLPMVLFITAASIGLKYLGAWISAIPSGRPRREWQAIAVSFTPSGVNGIIFAGLALEFNLIGNQELVAIVVSALVSTVLAGPWLRRAIETSFPSGKERLGDLVIRSRRLLGRYEAHSRDDALEHISPIIAQALTDRGSSTQSKDVVAAVNKVARGGYEILEAATARNIAFIHFSRPDIAHPLVLCFYSGTPVPWFGEYSIRLTVVFIVPENYMNVEMRTKRLAVLLHAIVDSKILNSAESTEIHRREVEALLERSIRIADGDEPEE